MAESYEELGFGPLGFYTANAADAAWIIMQAVLETHNPLLMRNLDALAVVYAFPDVADRYFGYSGWCRLDEFGDREAASYDIWGYGVDANGDYAIIRYGTYGISGEVTWYSDAYPPAPCP